MRFLCLLLLVLAGLLPAAPTITILHTNDLHQGLDNLPRIAGYVAQYRLEHPDTVFVDAGDWFDRGSSLPLVTRGEAIYGTMATMGYDGWVPGNHDWAYGGARLRELMLKYPVPVLGGNLAASDHPLPANVVPVLVKELAGLRVGFFGITIDSYGQDPKTRPYIHVLNARESTAKALRELAERKVDLIVAVTHLGFEGMAHEGQRKCPTDLDLAREFPAIDVIVGGHSHTALAEERIRQVHAETGAIVVQAGASGRFLGKLVLDLDPAAKRIAGFDVALLRVDESFPEHPETAAFLADQYARHMPNAKLVVGTIEEKLERHNAGYWYAEFLRAATGADLVLLPVDTFYKEPAAFPKGPVTVERLRSYFFDRHLVQVRVSGSDLLAYLRQPAMLARLNPLSDRGRPFTENAFYTAGFAARFDPGTKTVALDLDPAKDYTLVTPWLHSWRHLLDGEENGLPPRALAEQANPLPGMPHRERQLLPATSMALMLAAGTEKGLVFQRRFPEPRPDWEPWKTHAAAAR